jgi:hypothetical protein
VKTFVPNLSGTALKILGGILIVGAGPFILVGLWVFGKLDELGKFPSNPFVSLLALVGLWVLVYFLYRMGSDWYKQGKHRSAPSAASLMSKDPRPPVLYLRSFQDDSIAAQGKLHYASSGQTGGWYQLSLVAETEEEQLAQVMNEIGPFVAIGRPGEKVPEIGAARMYANDDEWRSKVLNLIGRAKLIVLRAGDSSNVLWELESVVKLVRPEQVILLVPDGSAQYNVFRRRVEKNIPSLPFALPDYFDETPNGIWLIGSVRRWLKEQKQSAAGSIRGILYFGPKWTPQLVELKGLGAEIPNPFAEALKRTLEPVFRQLGVPWKKPRWFRRRYRAR